MIKLLLTGVWAVLLLSGSLYFFNSGNESNASVNPGDDSMPFFGKLETVHLDSMSVALIRKNAVQGYIILDVSFIVDAVKNAKLTVPSKLIVQNAVNNAFLKNNKININRLDNFDAEALQIRLAEEVNEKVGEKLVSEVLLQRIDFLSSEDVRDTKLRGG